MMMPANFSAISENEMTYVNGGASLADILAPELKVENWQKFNTNMVTIIGNSFMEQVHRQHYRRSVQRRLQARQPGQRMAHRRQGCLRHRLRCWLRQA